MKKIFFTLLVACNFSSFAQDTLQGVTVEAKRDKLQKSLLKTANTTVITTQELLKAACCNLAESFETNPSIDVSFSDALTGTKQIKMLGLTSPYLMITEEKIPSVRGASQVYGLSFTPGTWIENIQITKGAGSVVNGYESISGQINTELIKPLKDNRGFLNAYASTDSRYEINAHANHKFSPKLATSFYFHGNTRLAKFDNNDDDFLDAPIGKQVNFTNRWQYSNAETGWVSFLNFKYLKDQKQTGMLEFNPYFDRLTTNHWGSEIKSNRFDVSSKIGYIFKDMPFQSIGFQNAYNRHDQQSYFGITTYDIKQESYFSNLVFNSIINNTNHKFVTGLNFTFDRYEEYYNRNDVGRIDKSMGAFFEYNFDNSDKISYSIGGRIDSHNRLGVFFTPRFHFRYNPWEQSVFRFSAGRGKRTSNIYAENQQLFASSRLLSVLDSSGQGINSTNSKYAYGLNPEIAWNYGISFTQKFMVLGKRADATIDIYRTDFQNQTVVDLYNSPQTTLFYNTNKSVANSMQVEFNAEIIKHFNLRTAYKYYDITTDYLSGNKQNPLQAKHRFFSNLEYQSHLNDQGQHWKLDATLSWIGRQKLPFTASNPLKDQFAEFSNPFSLLNVQATLVFSPTFEIYFGGENITNTRQNKAILGADNPFGSNFDASIVYAPIFGQMFYGGLRFKIK
jgi:outer membrane receptor for ferrienterochelin and colicins